MMEGQAKYNKKKLLDFSRMECKPRISPVVCWGMLACSEWIGVGFHGGENGWERRDLWDKHSSCHFSSRPNSRASMRCSCSKLELWYFPWCPESKPLRPEVLFTLQDGSSPHLQSLSFLYWQRLLPLSLYFSVAISKVYNRCWPL